MSGSGEIALVDDKPKVRRQILLYKAARATGRSSDRLKKDLEARGFVVTGKHKSRHVYEDDLAALQVIEDQEAREQRKNADREISAIRQALNDRGTSGHVEVLKNRSRSPRSDRASASHPPEKRRE